MAFQLVDEYFLEPSRAFILAELIEPEAGPGGRAHFEDPGRAARFVLVGVGADQPVLRLLEEIGEGGERPRGAQPSELVRFQRQRRLELFLEGLADATVDAVRTDD